MILVKANNFSIHWRAIPDLLGYVWVHIDTSVWNPSYELRWKSVLVALICYLNRLEALKQLGAIRLSVVIFAMDFCLEGPLIMTFCCSIFRVFVMLSDEPCDRELCSQSFVRKEMNLVKCWGSEWCNYIQGK